MRTSMSNESTCGPCPEYNLIEIIFRRKFSLATPSLDYKYVNENSEVAERNQHSSKDQNTKLEYEDSDDKRGNLLLFMEDLEEMDQSESLGEENEKLLDKDEGLQAIYRTSPKPRIICTEPYRKQCDNRGNSLDIENRGNSR